MPRPRITAQDLVDRLRELARENPNITVPEFCRAAGVSRMLITDRHDNWGNLRERAGLPRHRTPASRKVSTPEEVRAAFQRAVADLGTQITRAQFIAHTGHSAHEIVDRCGSWTALRASANLKTGKHYRRRIHLETILADYDHVRNIVGRRPVDDELRILGKYGIATYRHCHRYFEWVRRAERVLADRAEQTRREQEAAAPAAAEEQGEVTET